MPSRPFAVTVQVDGVRETLAALNRLGPDANRAIRDKSVVLSGQMAAALQAAARAQGRQAAILAVTVKPRRDRVPVVNIGGTSPQIGRRWPGRGRAKPYELLFGSEFGGGGHGFLPHRGRAGYWVWPTILAEQPRIAQAWNDAAEQVVRQFGSRP